MFDKSVAYPTTEFSDCFVARIVDVRGYDDLLSYLEEEDWGRVLPRPDLIKSLDDAIVEYHRFYSDKEIKQSGGMIAIELEPGVVLTLE